MDEKNLFTADKEAVPEREVYLSLLAVEIYGNKSRYGKKRLTYPAKISIEYLKYQDLHLKYLQTCLRKFHTKNVDDFTKPKSEFIEELIDEDIHNSIDEAVELISKDFEDFDFISPQVKHLNINLLSNQNEHASSYVKSLHSNMVVESKMQSEIITVLKLKKTKLNNFEKKVYAIGKAGLMRVAYDFAKKRALMDGEKYRFKKLVSEISEACEDYYLNSKTGEPKSKLSPTNIAELAKNIIKNYEVLGNNNYLIDVSGYKKAVEKHIKSNFDEYSKK